MDYFRNLVTAASNLGSNVYHTLEANLESTEDLSTSESERAIALKKRSYEEFSLPHKNQHGLEIRKLNLKLDHKHEEHKVQKFSMGMPTSKPTKTILLVGATGTGKTTLINNMANYIFRVQFTDPFRLMLIDDKDAPTQSQAHSQTDIITAYVFNHIYGMPFEYNYVLIDTPGFGDTRGLQRDREMMQQLENFLKQNYGIDSVDAVGFVTPSSAARLTQTQLYVFEGLLSMFGKDIRDNIYVIATFADAKDPPVLEALKAADIDYRGYYKFNNSALFARSRKSKDNDEEADFALEICELYWGMGYRNMEDFFKKLGRISPVSLTLTKEVLEERNSLQTVVIGLQNQIHIGMGQLSILEQEKNMLNKIDDEMKGAVNYEEEVDVPKINKIDLQPGTYTTNCIKCNVTCHFPCAIPDDSRKMGCAAMVRSISPVVCRVCPNKCQWDLHKNMGFRFEHKYVKEKRTLQELLDRYNNAEGEKLSKTEIVKAHEDAINASSSKLIDLIKQAQKCVERLEEIALKPNPLSTTEYIDIMIESEKMQKRPDFEKRIKLLDNLRREAIVLHGVRGDLSDKSGVELLTAFKEMMQTDN